MHFRQHNQHNIINDNRFSNGRDGEKTFYRNFSSLIEGKKRVQYEAY